jgi:hypothetical protein
MLWISNGVAFVFQQFESEIFAANAINPDGSTVIVMDLSFKYLGRHLDFGVRFGPSGGTYNWYYLHMS